MLLGARTLGHIHGVGQFVERNLALVRRLFADAAARAHQDVGERIENPPQHPERPCRELRETHRHGLRQYFGQYLAEQQQQESHQYGLEQELETQERKTESMIPDTRMTMQIFTRLLTTRIVASSTSTFVSKCNTASAEAVVRVCRRRISLCDREKTKFQPPIRALKHTAVPTSPRTARRYGPKTR